MSVGERLRNAGEGRTRLIAGIAITLAVVIVGFVLWRHGAASASTHDAQVDGHINPVATRVGGTVRSVEIRENQFVESGTVLVRIDPTDYDVALRRAEAEAADARAAAEAARAGVPITSAASGGQLAAAHAGMQQAQTVAVDRLAVDHSLGLQGSITDKMLDLQQKNQEQHVVICHHGSIVRQTCWRDQYVQLRHPVASRRRQGRYKAVSTIEGPLHAIVI
jgi:multidrug resistance efflux pump